jgi:phage/plasmid-like protein (TIGR03299 family)
MSTDIRNPLDERRRGWDRSEYGDGGFESGVFTNREPAWHGLGTVVDDPDLSWTEALVLGGLDWTVEKWDIAAVKGTNRLKAPAKKAIVRSSDQRVLGVVGNGYRAIQQSELGELGDAILDSGDVRCISAVSLKNGSRVALVSKLGDDIKIAGWEDETIEPYLLVTNSHDGSLALTIAITPIRVVCTNTLRLALGGSTRMWKVRHTTNYQGKLDEARRALGLTYTYLADLEKAGNEMVKQPMTDKQFGAFLEKLAPKKKGDDDPDSRTEKNRQAALTVIGGIYQNSPNLENVRGTRWAALNAVAEYSDWYTQVRKGDEARYNRAMNNTKLKDRAYALLTR